MTPAQHIAYANTTQVKNMATYISKGGLPAMVGEWALAGLLALRCVYEHSTQSCLNRHSVHSPSAASVF
jgi:hypothetical protein